MFRTKVISTRVPFMALTAMQRRNATTKPQPISPGSERLIGFTNTRVPDFANVILAPNATHYASIFGGDPMYAVMGITGQVGSAVANTLLERGEQVRAIVRNPEKAKAWAARGAQLIKADYNDATALEAAFSGAKCIF